MAVTTNNINQLKENVNYLINLGFKTINLQFDFFYIFFARFKNKL